MSTYPATNLTLITCAGGPRSTQKDMGGLLQEDKRDFLVYRLGEVILPDMGTCKM